MAECRQSACKEGSRINRRELRDLCRAQAGCAFQAADRCGIASAAGRGLRYPSRGRLHSRSSVMMSSNRPTASGTQVQRAWTPVRPSNPQIPSQRVTTAPALGKNSCSPPTLYPAIARCPSGEISQSMKACPCFAFTPGCLSGFTSITP
jgi:hypothetical protein